MRLWEEWIKEKYLRFRGQNVWENARYDAHILLRQIALETSCNDKRYLSRLLAVQPDDVTSVFFCIFGS